MIQHEVEKRLTELRNLNESANKGRVKSQRGGPGEIFVKKSVDWPQHFILTGTHKTLLPSGCPDLYGACKRKSQNITKHACLTT